MADVVFGVSQINEYISRKIYTDLFMSNLNVMGEVTNFSMSSIGHAFFSLKDENAILDCIIYDYYKNKETEPVIEGEKVIAKGRITFFKKTGKIQFAVESTKQQGIGDLYAKFEKTKQKLIDEGIFDEIYKKPIPEFPKHIGVVTSAAGAAVHDIINVATRRFDGVHITVYPAKVQGIGAAEEITSGIKYFNQREDVDVLIVGRGGGSFEDLFAFNEEIVARTVFESEIPVISAVGHETDYSLCDMAADLRAPTPSAAAELVVKDKGTIINYLDEYNIRLFDSLYKNITQIENRLNYIKEKIMAYPLLMKIEQAEHNVLSIENLLKMSISTVIEKNQMFIEKLDGSLKDLNPRGILERGYAIIYDENKRVVTSAKGKEKKLDIELIDGHIFAERKG